VSRRLRARSDWQVPQRMSADRNLNGRFWESREAAAGHEATVVAWSKLVGPATTGASHGTHSMPRKTFPELHKPA
jgi:hypothetical protein